MQPVSDHSESHRSPVAETYCGVLVCATRERLGSVAVVVDLDEPRVRRSRIAAHYAHKVTCSRAVL